MGNSRKKYSKIYLKAVDFFKLSRRFATQVTGNREVSFDYRGGERIDNYADNLVVNAYRLMPKVAEIEVEKSAENKLKSAKSLKFLIDRLYQDCINLENSRLRRKEFVKHLKNELKSFQQAYNQYLNSLV